MAEMRDFCLHIDGVNLLLFVHRPSIISARNRWIRESNCLDWCNAIKLGVGLKMEFKRNKYINGDRWRAVVEIELLVDTKRIIYQFCCTAVV
mgnify:CR=1 FL=1